MQSAFIRKFDGRDVALRRPRPVQGRNTTTSIATLHASRSVQRTDPTLTMRLAGFDALDACSSGRESAPSDLGRKFEPTHVGCYSSRAGAGNGFAAAAAGVCVGRDVLRSGHQAGGACARPPASTAQAKSKKRSQFRVASKNIGALYETVETVEV